MVCNRCIKTVRNELTGLGLHPEVVALGEVTLTEEENQVDREKVRQVLMAHGFELLENKKAWIVEKVKNTIIDLVHYHDASPYNFSYLIEEKTGMDYAYLSSLFSVTERITIEKYVILQRIERVKELLVYDQMNLSEIAYALGYSSVQHLSNQFKKVTGLTPSHFKKLKENKRRPLDAI